LPELFNITKYNKFVAGKTMLTKIIITLLAVVIGGWMIFDGSHVLLTEKYFGPTDPGLWANIVTAVGINPYDIGGIFVLLGICWIAGLIGLHLKKDWAYELSIAVAAASLWYAPVGTILAAVFLIIILSKGRGTFFIRSRNHS
jgi:hypothetical protein